MRRVINKHGLRFLIKETVQELSARNKEKRLAYATAMKNYNWKTVVFSDEKTFSMTNRAWQVPGKRKKHPVKRYPQKINVWAAAGSFMKSQLYFFRAVGTPRKVYTVTGWEFRSPTSPFHSSLL